MASQSDVNVGQNAKRRKRGSEHRPDSVRHVQKHPREPVSSKHTDDATSSPDGSSWVARSHRIGDLSQASRPHRLGPARLSCSTGVRSARSLDSQPEEARHQAVARAGRSTGLRCLEHPPEEELVHGQREDADGEAADAERKKERAQGERTAVAIELINHVEHAVAHAVKPLNACGVLVRPRSAGGRHLGNGFPELGGSFAL